MKVISTYAHGLIDYFVGALLAAAPWLLGFAHGGAETWVCVILGLGALLYSLFTNYELGVIRVIPMPMHLTLDMISGVFLILSPWLLGFSARVHLPQVCFGILEILVVLLSQTVPGPSQNPARASAR